MGEAGYALLAENLRSGVEACERWPESSKESELIIFVLIGDSISDLVVCLTGVTRTDVSWTAC